MPQFLNYYFIGRGLEENLKQTMTEVVLNVNAHGLYSNVGTGVFPDNQAYSGVMVNYGEYIMLLLEYMDLKVHCKVLHPSCLSASHLKPKDFAPTENAVAEDVSEEDEQSIYKGNQFFQKETTRSCRIIVPPPLQKNKQKSFQKKFSKIFGLLI